MIEHRPKHRRHVGLTLAILFAVSLLYLSWRGGFTEFLVAAVAGILPALFWLWFWLHEDSVHPEPQKAIFKAFLFGALTVPISIVLEQGINFVVRWGAGISNASSVGIENLPGAVILLLFLLWAVVEEYGKYKAAKLAEFTETYYDEPIDAVIYLISAALGFSAFESMLFVWQTIFESGPHSAIFIGQLRFLGAALLHVICSAVVGFSVGFSFYRDVRTKKRFLAIGLLTAVLLHTLFNFSIITLQGAGTLIVFTLLWIATIGIFLLFEKIKRVPNKTYVQQNQ